MKRIIWQYWEGPKPDYIKQLEGHVLKYCDAELFVLNEETVNDWLPDLPAEISRLRKPAHRADVIRSFLLKRYGGLWIDIDIVVTKPINFIFDALDEYEFVSYNEVAALSEDWKLRVGVIASRPYSKIVSLWNSIQVPFIKQFKIFDWTAIGADMLSFAGKKHPNTIKVFDIHTIEPIHWQKTETFHEDIPVEEVVTDEVTMVSFHNSRLENKVFKPNTLGYRLLENYA